MSDTCKRDKKPRNQASRPPFRQPGRGPYGKPAPAPERRDGRPAPLQPGERERQPARRDARPDPVPERRYGRPALPQQRRKPEPILSQDARRAALLVLHRVLQDGAYASLSLDEIFANMRLSQQDKRLTAVIVYKTIEDLIKLDYALDQFLKDAQALNIRIRNILRLSACQILLMDRIPDFAAVNEAVELTRACGFEDMTGLVNGVLRSLIRQKDALAWPAPEDPNYLSVTHSIPQWLLDIFLASYPEDTALRSSLTAIRTTQRLCGATGFCYARRNLMRCCAGRSGTYPREYWRAYTGSKALPTSDGIWISRAASFPSSQRAAWLPYWRWRLRPV